MIKKQSIYILIIFLLAFTMLFQPTRGVIQKTAADFFYPFFSLVLKIKNIVNQKALARKSKNILSAKVLELQRDNSKLSAKCEHIEALLNENNELRKLLGLKPNPYYNYIFAEIIYRDPLEWFNRFTINKGETDLIENGAVVLARISTDYPPTKTQFGVVGRIDSISKHTASVSTIVSDQCNLSVFIPENGATGVLTRGERNGSKCLAKVSYLPMDLIYKPFSPVLTSGMSSLTPANLKVGNIMEEKDSAAISVYNNLFVEAKLKPAVDLNHLKTVLILVKK
jgi:rod shape-determining protein MreC